MREVCCDSFPCDVALDSRFRFWRVWGAGSVGYYHPAVQNACAWEYHNFCSQYGIGSELLDLCFRQNAAHMTKACVDALIAAGDVSNRRSSSVANADIQLPVIATCYGGVVMVEYHAAEAPECRCGASTRPSFYDGTRIRRV